MGFFNNRELAIGVWIIIAFVGSLFTKTGRDFFKNTLPILFSKSFVIFYLIMSAVLVSGVWLLYNFKFWDWSMLKDTILWVFFVEIPVCAKAIQEAKNERFFLKIIKESVQIIVVIEFILNYWTFSFWVEFIWIPIAVICGMFLAVAQHQKQKSVAKFFEKIFIFVGLVLIITAVVNFFRKPVSIINIATLKLLLLPILLLLLNMPVVYALSLYGVYEQIFIRLKGQSNEKKKMKRAVVSFAKINLKKAYQLQKNIMGFLITVEDVNKNLKRVKAKMDMDVGENYMKRAKYIIISSIIVMLGAIMILIFCNVHASLRDILRLNFIVDMKRINEILTNLAVGMISVSIPIIIVALGFRKKKFEEISNIKKFAIFKFLSLLAEQDKFLKMSEDPLKDPWEVLFYIAKPAYNIFIESNIILASYDNLLKDWESESIRTLNTYSNSLLSDIKQEYEEFPRLNGDDFAKYYKNRKKTAPQNEKINTYISFIETDIEKYKSQIAICMDMFKYLLIKD
jgi:hypothetical protein